jgi:N4-gp56 family major capsid protein
LLFANIQEKYMATINALNSTSFAAMNAEEKKIWSLNFWKEVRNQSFLTGFLGADQNAVVQRVSELKATEKGTKAIIHLIPNASLGGVAGDNTLRGNEDTVTAHSMEIQYDQYAIAMANKGRMDDQKSVFDFRTVAKDQLAYGMAKLVDELAFQTMAGIPYTLNVDGSPRTTGQVSQLAFAADVSAPTANRWLRYNPNTDKLEAGDTATMTSDNKMTYRALVRAKAYAVSKRIKGLTMNGKETYHVFVDPITMSNLKLDPDFLANVRAAAASLGNNSELFKGGIPTVDGLVIHESMYVPNTLGAASGSKWGSDGKLDGARCLVVGAQALAFADINTPEWEEQTEDYNRKFGISISKIFGFKKPKFMSSYSGTVEDVGVIAFDVAL